MSSQSELDATKNGTNKAGETPDTGISKRDIRVKLARELWIEYNKSETSQANKIKIATVLAKLTEKSKVVAKPIFN